MILCDVAQLSLKLAQVFLTFAILCPLSSAFAERPRTDGPPGSEYGSSSIFNGELQIAGRFGAVIPGADTDNTSLMLGGDIDYRPFDLFGFQLSYLQGIQKRGRIGLLNFTPLLHYEFFNLRPHAIFGPGLAFYKAGGDTQTKFTLNFGGGADFMLTENFGVGMNYTYHALFGAEDSHSLGARLLVSFGR